MKYSDYLKEMKGCPFCEDIDNRIILENNSAYITCAYAPYHKYHLLIVPKRHFQYVNEFNKEELVDTYNLLNEALKLMKLAGIESSNVFIRDGGSKGKSIEHLHIHLVPDRLLVYNNPESDFRKFSEKDALEMAKKLRSLLNTVN